MSVDKSIIRAIADSVEANPDNLALRLHLSDLLCQADRHDECLRHCTIILGSEPDHLEALALSHKAATALGKPDLASRYQRLLSALTATLDGSASESSVAESNACASPSEVSTEAVGDSSAQGKKARTNRDGSNERPETRSAEVISLSGRRVDSEPEPPRPKAQPPRPNRDDENEPSDDLGDENRKPVALLAIDGGGGVDELYERPEITMDDVKGMQSVKERLELAFLGPMRNPEIRKLYGKSLRGGLLLYGPPGCGKTFIARATAGELGAGFFSIGLSDVLDMWLGESERKLHELFETARRHTPCVLFIDEIDALGHKRSQLRGAGRTIVNQLLDELDNVSRSNEGVFLLSATNHPWDVDTALRRPGRLDRTVLVTPPDAEARMGILKYYLQDRPQDKIDVEWLTKKTRRFSGADLAHLCESAAELAIADAVKSGRARPITMSDMKKALKSVKPSTESWLQTAKNYAQYANEGGVYDDLLEWFRHHG